MSDVASVAKTDTGLAHGDRWAPIVKPCRPWRVEPNLADYDRVDAALDHIQRHAVERVGLVPRAVSPSRLLGERAVAQVRRDSWAQRRFTEGTDYAA